MAWMRVHFDANFQCHFTISWLPSNIPSTSLPALSLLLVFNDSLELPSLLQTKSELCLRNKSHISSHLNPSGFEYLSLKLRVT